MRRPTALLLGIIAHPIALTVAKDAAAQSPWLEPLSDRSIYVEVLKPSVDGPPDFTFLTTTWFLAGRVALSEDWVMVAEIPFALAELDPSESTFPSAPAESELESQLGNIYLGLDWRTSEARSVEFGLRLPIVDSARAVSDIAGVTDLVDRGEAFLEDVLPLQVAATYRKRWESGIRLRVRGSPVADIDLDSFSGTQVFLITTVQLWFERDAFVGGLGLSDRLHVNSIGEDYGSITRHQFVLFTRYNSGEARPGLQVRLPLDGDVRDLINVVIAATIAMEL